MDEEMKRFLQEELKKDADRIMEEVERDPEVAGVEAAPDLHEKLFAQIRQYEEEKEKVQEKQKTYEELPEEYRELVQLGRIYKRRKKNRKYLVLAAVMVLTMAVGVTSIGGPERLFKEMKWAIGGREQVNVDSDSERVAAPEASGEAEAYQAIKDEFGFEPVRMIYLPQQIEFVEASIDQNLKMARFNYCGNEKESIIYRMYVNYNPVSVGLDVEDQLIETYMMYCDEIPVEVKEYRVKETNEQRWIVKFEHQKIQYFMTINNLKQGEMEKIIKNLYFL